MTRTALAGGERRSQQLFPGQETAKGLRRQAPIAARHRQQSRSGRHPVAALTTESLWNSKTVAARRCGGGGLPRSSARVEREPNRRTLARTSRSPRTRTAVDKYTDAPSELACTRLSKLLVRHGFLLFLLVGLYQFWSPRAIQQFGVGTGDSMWHRPIADINPECNASDKTIGPKCVISVWGSSN